MDAGQSNGFTLSDGAGTVSRDWKRQEHQHWTPAWIEVTGSRAGVAGRSALGHSSSTQIWAEGKAKMAPVASSQQRQWQ
jgi:hypothetical protein